MSCTEPQTSLVLGTTLSPADACEAIEASIRNIAERVGPPPDYVVTPPEASCFFQGDLQRIHPRAHLIATVISGSDVANRHWLLADTDPASLEGAPTVVALRFTSPSA